MPLALEAFLDTQYFIRAQSPELTSEKGKVSQITL
jgi:hypothetical protein